MYCVNCGKKLDVNAELCEECMLLKNNGINNIKRVNNIFPMIISLIGVAVLIGYIIMLLKTYFSIGSGNEDPMAWAFIILLWCAPVALGISITFISSGLIIIKKNGKK